jgi:hypothetical protein
MIFKGEIKVKVIGIYGSPRMGGNSDLLLDNALLGAKKRGLMPKRYMPEI